MLKKSKILMVICIITILLITACSSNDGKSEKSVEGEMFTSEDTTDNIEIGFNQSIKEDEKADITIDGNKNTVDNTNNDIIGMKPKLIITNYLDLETLDYENTINYIREEVTKLDGYIEHSEIEGGSINNKGYGYRRAYYKLRIPTTKAEDFIDKVGNIGVIRSSGEEAADITQQYFDSESRLKSKKIQEERLLNILENATDLEGIIELEKELADVRYEIDSLTSQLRKWDNLVDYTTIYLNVYEVKETIDVVYNPTLKNRVSQALKSSLIGLRNVIENLIIFIVASLPFLIVFGLPILLILFFIKGKIKKKSIKVKTDKDPE